VDVATLLRRLGEERDVTIRRALLLSLGPEGFGEKAWTAAQKRRLLGRLRELYRTADDPGVHGAAEWLLRQWRQDAWLEQTNDKWAEDKGGREKRLRGIHQLRTRDKGKAPPQWYVNGQGQTMVVIPGPVEFVMGSPPTEDGRKEIEAQHRKRIGRAFALAAKPVTVREFWRFLRERPGLVGRAFALAAKPVTVREFWRFLRERPGLEKAFQGEAAALLKRYSPEADCPMCVVNWYMAAMYCNWLSGKEGIARDQWCYETDRLGNVTKLKANYLGLTGYRLPTEAEWEYACRAGAVTSRYYGEAEELLGKYGWYIMNARERSWPVGTKKPSDLGLFDMHGNVWTWCQERYRPYPTGPGREAKGDIEDILSINEQDSRVLRGGSFNNYAVDVRSASRYKGPPTGRNYIVGLRPARTFTP
jgi:formylglycine-generating enzyme required for sulfatase activity